MHKPYLIKNSMQNTLPYDKTNPLSIFEYSKQLLHHCIRDFAPNTKERSGKGGIGQMVEELFFKYDINSNPNADFSEAGMELKCTPLKLGKKGDLLIKERLVGNIIDYMSVVNEDFEHSHFYLKCQLMLIMFYLHREKVSRLDLEFLFTVLWKLPQKDLLIIKHDYETIVNKIKSGQAHLLSEGDTMYLGACTKGEDSTSMRTQPYSDILAKQRAFSLKPAYMRIVLNYIQSKNTDAIINEEANKGLSELVSLKDLQKKSFEEIILDRFIPYYRKDYLQICNDLGKKISFAKHKYALISNGIVSGQITDVNNSEEFKKSGITLKTVRVEQSGRIEQSMSFEEIDYCEVANEEYWEDSRLYEIFSSRFLFVVYKSHGETITLHGKDAKGMPKTEVENKYVLDKVFFWTMPQKDLEDAKKYWLDIKKQIADNHIDLDYFYKIADNLKFHVRPKGTKTNYYNSAINPNGGYCNSYCYWFNSSYVKSIIEDNR